MTTLPWMGGTSAGHPVSRHILFYDSPDLSDVSIKLGNRTIKAHKVILAQGSQYFERMFCGRFKEAEAKEVGLFDDDPNALEAVLRFLYGQTNAIEVVHYQNLNSTVLSGSDLGCMEIGAQVYVVADKYGVSGLKFKVLEYMRPLPGFCTVSARDLVAAIGIIWTSTSDNDALARPLLIHTCAEHFEKFINEEGFEQTLRQHGLEIDICRILAVSSYPGCGKPCCWS